jgi:hypothetical protein
MNRAEVIKSYSVTPDGVIDNYRVGQTVEARFTNSGRFLQFPGIIVGETTRYWKIESIISPWEGEAPGRVFHIWKLGTRNYSANNCIVKEIQIDHSAKG